MKCQITNCNENATVSYTQSEFRDRDDNLIPFVELKTLVCEEHGEIIANSERTANEVKDL